MVIEVTEANSISMLWLIPQFFIMAIAEVMLSVTGYIFCFTQAPPSMRAVMSSCWLLTIAFGNVIVIFVASAHGMLSQSMEFFLFAGLMVLDMLLFFFLASRYTYFVVKTQDMDKVSFKRSTIRKMEQGNENKGFSESEF